MSEEGQAQEQPTAQDLALNIVESWSKPEVKTEEGQAPEVPAEETTETPEEQQPETKTEVRRLKLKYKGEDREVDEPEAIELAQKGYDYTQKSQALAKERQEMQETIRQQTEPALKQYQERLQLFEKAVWQALAPEVNQTDWNKLAQENPAEWAVRMQRVTDVNRVLEGVKQEQQRLAHESQQKVRQQQQQAITEAIETLQAEIPGWNEELYKSVLKSGTEFGFTSQEVGQIVDPRAIKVLHAAHKWSELQKAKPSVDKKVANVPKVVKPGTAEKPDQRAEKWKETANRIKKSQGTDQEALLDAAKFLV